MTIILQVLLQIMAFLFGVICTVVAFSAAENRDRKKKAEEKQKKKDARKKNIEAIKEIAPYMCQRTRDAGICPGVCEKCAWGFNYDER